MHFFSLLSYWSSVVWTHSSAHFFLASPGDGAIVRRLERSLVQIAVQAFWMTLAMPDLSSLAWNCAALLLSYRSNSGTKASVSSFLIGVVRNAPRTFCRPVFWCMCSLEAGPRSGLPFFVGLCQIADLYKSAGCTTAK